MSPDRVTRNGLRASPEATAAQQPKHRAKRCAYVTLLTRDGYLPGAQALLRSLSLARAAHPLVVLYTAGVSGASVAALQEEGAVPRYVEQYLPPGVDHSEYKRELYLECWNKLRMWAMTEWDRLVYLDADMIVCRNVDALFDLPPGFYAVGDCYGGREAAEERDACCHFRPHEPPGYFNGGFWVMSPCPAELASMEDALAAGRCAVRFFAEQDFLNGYFQGRWRPLPYTFNAQKRIKFHHPDLWRLEDIHIIHYVDEKPWSHPTSEENLAYQDIVRLWWRAYAHVPRGPALVAGDADNKDELPAYADADITIQTLG